ncbi:hypothetical protein PC116_g34601 [Phytophthora cactorum]|nr:hypothetical protein PC116_g34601 [Phytophthora cactorum]
MMDRGEGKTRLREGDGVGVLRELLSCEIVFLCADRFPPDCVRGSSAGSGEKTFDRRAGFCGGGVDIVNGSSSFSSDDGSVNDGVRFGEPSVTGFSCVATWAAGMAPGATIPKVPLRIRNGGGTSSSLRRDLGLLCGLV